MDNRALDAAINQALAEKLASDDPLMQKEALDAINDFTRIQMREDGFLRRIMPPLPITNDELDREVDNEKPVKIVDKEPESPAAVSIPLGNLPTNVYIRGDRYKVHFSRLTTPRFTKDVDELRTYYMDIRQIMSDNAIKDMLAEEDDTFIYSVDEFLVGPNVTMIDSGIAQYQTISGGITRDSLWDALKIMPSAPWGLEVNKALINHITVKDFAKMGHEEMGGTMAQEVFRDGWTAANFMGIEWIVTIKKGIVGTNHMYMFADPKFIGKFYQLEDTTMYIDRKAWFIEFFAYEYVGATIGHTGGLAHAYFN